MKELLKKELLKKILNPEYYSFCYDENNNKDALTNDWIENRTSYIYKVAVMTAIDSNKCDFAHVVIGVQRGENSEPELKGYFYFSEGENDDMGRVIERAFKPIKESQGAMAVGKIMKEHFGTTKWEELEKRGRAELIDGLKAIELSAVNS